MIKYVFIALMVCTQFAMAKYVAIKPDGTKVICENSVNVNTVLSKIEGIESITREQIGDHPIYDYKLFLHLKEKHHLNNGSAELHLNFFTDHAELRAKIYKWYSDGERLFALKLCHDFGDKPEIVAIKKCEAEWPWVCYF